MRILLFGDIPGIPQLLRHVPVEHVVGIVGAVIRPQYLDALSQLAAQLNVACLIQPKWGADQYGEFKSAISKLQPDLIWVNSYSMILREDVLRLARLGGINIHGALLPRYRGCNPTQWAIINGETETGVTLHEMSAGIDEGAIIDQRRVPLFFEDTWQTARDRVAKATDDLIAANLPNLISGLWQARAQEESKSQYCRRRTPNDGLFDWSHSVIDIYNKIRALLPPLPSAFYLDESGHKVSMDTFLSPAGVAGLKYGAVGGVRLEIDRIRLRPLRREDFHLLYEWITHRELVILNAPFHPISEIDHETWIESMMTRRIDLVVFVIEELDNNQAIGTCQLININWRHRSAELQIRIGDERFESRGYGFEAVNLLCRFGFADLNLHRIYLHVFGGNLQAINAHRKCGFVQEGLLKHAAFIDGQWTDVAVMGLLQAHE